MSTFIELTVTYDGRSEEEEGDFTGKQWFNFRMIDGFYNLEAGGAQLVFFDPERCVQVEETAEAIAATLNRSNYMEALHAEASE